MKLLIVISSLLITATLNAQSQKIKFHRISFTFPAVMIKSGDAGLAVSLSTELKHGQHLYKLFLQTASEYNIAIGPSSRLSFNEANIMYGRTLSLKSWLSLDGLLGLGVFTRNISIPQPIDSTGSSCGFGGFCIFEGDHNYIDNRTTTLGVPLQMVLRVKTGKRFSLGLLLHTNLNIIENIISVGLNFSLQLGKLIEK